MQTDTTDLNQSVARQAAKKPDTIVIAGKAYFTDEGLAAEIGKHLRTLQRMIAEGIGPPMIKLGGSNLFDPDKIPGWLASLEKQPVRLKGRNRSRAA